MGKNQDPPKPPPHEHTVGGDSKNESEQRGDTIYVYQRDYCKCGQDMGRHQINSFKAQTKRDK